LNGLSGYFFVKPLYAISSQRLLLMKPLPQSLYFSGTPAAFCNQ